MDRLEHGRDLPHLGRGHVAEDVAVPVHDAALPGRIGEELRSALGEPEACIRDDQSDPCEAALFEVLEERAPARFVLFGTLADAKNLPITLVVHTNRHEKRHIADLAGPAALEHDAIQIDVGVLAFNRSIAPGFDRCVDLLVQVRHGRGWHPRAPQSLRDVLDPAHRYASQIHLDQRLLDRGLATPVALDDRRLERLLAQLGYPQLHLAGLGLEVALVVARPGVATRLGSLVALRIAQPVGFRIEQRVQRLLDRAAHDPVEMTLDPLIVDRDDIRQRNRPILVSHGGFVPLFRLT